MFKPAYGFGKRAVADTPISQAHEVFVNYDDDDNNGDIDYIDMKNE